MTAVGRSVGEGWRRVGEGWRRQRDRWRAERAHHGRATAALHRLRHLLGVGALEARVAALEAELAAAREALTRRDARVDRLEGIAEVFETTTWLARFELAPTVLVSIVLPTRDRPRLLERAIRSVLAQRYPRWELLVVDDGVGAATKEVVARFGDARIRLLDGPRRGVAAARNVALAAARGPLVTYLDDDNEMGADWCKAVVWAFGTWPETEVCYGARLFGDRQTPDPGAPPGGAALQFLPWDRAALEQANLADLGTVAHRRDLREARFDEQLDAMTDWDLLLRLTRDTSPTRVPVVAVRYHLDAPDRISKVTDVPGAIAQVLGKVHGWRLGGDPTLDELLERCVPGARPPASLRGLVEWWPSDWAAGPGFLATLLAALAEGDGPVLECGSGLTTLVAATATAGSGRDLWVLEHDPYWFGLVDGLCARRGLGHVRRWRTPLVDVGGADWYDLDRVRDPLPDRFGLVVCDGPPGTTRGGRSGLFRVLTERLRGAVVLLDDAHRPGEAALVAALAAAGATVEEITDGEARIARLRLPDPAVAPRLGPPSPDRAE